jgi:uncharacterized protein (TIGR01777 family)
MSKKLILAGGSGAIGTRLIEKLADRYDDIVVLSRSASRDMSTHRVVQWDAKTQGDWSAEIDGADCIINLAGKSIQCRFTDENKRILWDSRVDSTRAIGLAISQCKQAPKTWINASGAAIYPESFDTPQTEDVLEIGSGFKAQLSVAWEAAAQEFPLPNTRQIITRITPVLDPDAGFIKPLKAITRFGLGGRVASGKQVISWIHYVDLCRAIRFLILEESLDGVFNVTAPDAKSNADFMHTLRKVMGMPIGIPAPKFAIQLSGPFTGVDPSLILDSSYVGPQRLIKAGFEFKYPDLNLALAELF